MDLAVSSARRESLSRIKVGGSRSGNLSIKIPTSLGEGEYRLVVVIDDSGQHAESDLSNNHVSDDRIIRVAPQTIDLAATAASFKIRGSAAAGKSYSSSVKITNLGNSNAKGQASFQMFLRDAEGNEIDVSSGYSRKLSIRSGKSSSVRLKFTVPDGASPGQYTLVARINPGDGMSDLSADNNEIVAGTFSIG